MDNTNTNKIIYKNPVSLRTMVWLSNLISERFFAVIIGIDEYDVAGVN